MSFWRNLYAAPAAPGPGPYGPLSATPDANGLRLPAGFSSRIIARSGSEVAGTGYTWHLAPDGGACFPLADGGWAYTSNSELPIVGGAAVVRFSADGTITSAQKILSNTSANCSGSPACAPPSNSSTSSCSSSRYCPCSTPRRAGTMKFCCATATRKPANGLPLGSFSPRQNAMVFSVPSIAG